MHPPKKQTWNLNEASWKRNRMDPDPNHHLFGYMIVFRGVPLIYKFTLPEPETNISPEKAILKMMFLFQRWDMFAPWSGR